MVARPLMTFLGTLAILALVLGLTAPAQAQAPKPDLAAQWLPEDAGYYSAMLRSEELVRIVGESKAWKALVDMPLVQHGLQQMRQAMEGPDGAQVQAVLDHPEVKRALALLGDMFSQEVFIYGDRDTADALAVLQRVQLATQFGPMIAAATHQPEHRVTPRLVFRALAQDPEKIKVPTTVIGFKLRKRDRAVEALGKIEGMLGFASIAYPKLAGLVKRTPVGDDEFLTITVRGDMIPWDELPLKQLAEMEAKKGDVEKVIDQAKKLQLVVALGVRGNYLLLMIGPSTDALAKLGQGKSLASRPEMRPLEKFADQRLISVSYSSKELAAAGAGQLDDVLGMVEETINATDLADDQKDEIRKDARALMGDIKKAMPAPAATSSFEFIVDRGVESYAYHWGDHAGMPQAKPLKILRHIGGHPILAFAGQCRPSVEDYDGMVKWLKRGHYYFEKFALPEMNERDRGEYKKAMGKFKPILARVDKTTRELLIPGIGEGEVALVLDAQLKSKQYCRWQQPFPEPMPVLEPALVFTLSDTEKFRQAMDQYHDAVNDFLAALHELAPDDVPEIRLPETKKAQGGGEILSCPLPEEWGVIEEIAPTIGIGDHVAAFTITPGHAKRLLKPTDPAFGGLLADGNKPLVGAIGFNWPGLIDGLEPWIVYGVRTFLENEPGVVDEIPAPGQAAPPKRGRSIDVPNDKPANDGPEKPKRKPRRTPKAALGPQASVLLLADEEDAPRPKSAKDDRQAKIESVVAQVRTVLKVARVLRSITCEIYVEDGVLVTHTLMEIRDID